MNIQTLFKVVVATFALATISASSIAETPLQIKPLSKLDLHYMKTQRATLNDIARKNFGWGFNGNKDHDIGLLQRTLDRNLVRNNDTEKLQAMGIILGDILARDLDMDWVVYEDKVGRSRALRYKKTDKYLFPVTMISRRREADNRTSVADIYAKAHGIISASIPPLPYQ